MPSVNFTVIRALVKRDLRLYFSNPTGYVFITLFIFLSAAAAFWQSRFFLNNLANLDQLNHLFPYLLLFFIPAITMGVWSEERRQGTEELLLTLPATDLEIVLGKYLSTLGIYTAAVVLSLSHLVVLFWLGGPDPGLMLANYLGYWFLGAALIAVGMVASLLSPSATIAFILGAVFCSLFVFSESILGVLGVWGARAGRTLAVFEPFADFARGVVSLSSVLYFASIVALALYLNVILVGRRHWAQTAAGGRIWFHHAARLVALGVALVSLVTIASRGSARLDVTAERLHSLSGETRDLLGELSGDRPVFIQAYISPEVPRPYVQTRENLLGFLREIDAAGGNRVQLVVNETEPYSEEAREAREKFGITAVPVPEVGGSQANVRRVFLGIAFTCGGEEDVIPFFDRGLPVEYELARSIRVVARTQRKRIGVVTTQMRVFGGFDFNNFNSTPAWSIVDELSKQYEVEQISATDSIAGKFDGMLVVLPSSLSQEEMDNVQEYVERGNPTMLLLDPLPIVDVGLSPSEESGANVNPFMRNRGPQPKPKGNINALLEAVGILWSKGSVVWDGYNPHPEMANLPPEVVFVGRGNQNEASFNDEVAAVRGLQEIVFLFPGTLSQASGSSYDFTGLLSSSLVSGVVPYQQLVSRSFFGTQLNPGGAAHYATSTDYPLAAHVRGETVTAGDTTSVDVIAVADIDFISEQFFEIRRRGFENLNFDNVSFMLNCMDVLVGDESFVALRNRRLKHRTLTTVEARVRAFSQQRATEEQDAEREAQQALSEAQRRLDERVGMVRNRTDLDENTKQIMARNIQEVESRRFETVKSSIETERDARIEASKEEMEAHVRRIQSNIRTLAGVIPPIPVFLIGVGIFVRRRRREKEGAAAARRLRD
jgi:ABC-2 type transport system permease protein